MDRQRNGTSRLIGNDIIDLSLPPVSAKVDNSRFMNRICSSEEEKLLAATQKQQLLLWYMWSAKESAYKIAKKYHSETVFSPKQFIVNRISSCIWLNNEVDGEVSYKGMHIPVRWQHRSTYIHCVGVWPDQTGAFDEIAVGIEDLSSAEIIVEKRLSRHETESILSSTSQRVRQLAKQLLSEHGLNDVEIIRHRAGNCWGPPYIRRHKRILTECDLSLSHHGRFIAAAVWVKENGDWRSREE